MVTFYPAAGINPLGHCVALFHFLTNFYLLHYPGGGGQLNLQITAVTFIHYA